MALGIECLVSDDLSQARAIANALNEINAERRAVQQQMTDEAERALARVTLDGNAIAASLCLFDAEWHPGVVGLVASKIKERVHRPVIAFAPAEPGSQMLRGSARSIPGLHIRDALASVDAANPGLLGKFGGHAMAAGLSLSLGDLPRFEQALSEQVESMLDPSLLQAEILSDGPLHAHEFDRASAEAFGMAARGGRGIRSRCSMANSRW